MEYKVVYKFSNDYSPFFKVELSKSGSKRLFKEVQLNLIGKMTSVKGFGIPDESVIEQVFKKSMCISKGSVYDTFFQTGDKGGLSKHYLAFGERILELTESQAKWRIDWDSVSLPQWIKIAHKEVGVREFKISEYERTMLALAVQSAMILHESELLSGNSPGKRYSLGANIDIKFDPDTTYNNPQILKYSSGLQEEVTKKDQKTGKTISQMRNMNISNDEVAWCSCFAQWVFRQCGIIGPTVNPALALSWKNWGTPLNTPAFGAIVVFRHKNGTGHVGFVLGEKDNRLIVLGGNQGDRVCIAEFGKKEVVQYVYPSSAQLSPFGYYLTEIASEGRNERDR
ncbi:MAG: TIGR02594 family protein [Bacteroidetes bacterium]|nr:TIGR02594 family protein [Bacteroidota bacterium]